MVSINEIRCKAFRLCQKSKALVAYAAMTAAASMLVSQSHAQTFAEWFSQKKTQKKYLLQQIAALQVYSGYLWKGYKIANGGLGDISGELKNEVLLHTSFYEHLQGISPAVKNDPQVNDILGWQLGILNATRSIGQITGLTPEETRYTAKVNRALLEDVDQQSTNLQALLATGRLEMTDEERLNRLHLIWSAMQSNYQFVLNFSSQLKLYAVQKRQEAKDINVAKKLLVLP